MKTVESSVKSVPANYSKFPPRGSFTFAGMLREGYFLWGSRCARPTKSGPKPGTSEAIIDTYNHSPRSHNPWIQSVDCCLGKVKPEVIVKKTLNLSHLRFMTAKSLWCQF